jgi:hypothetical membrane protein
MTEAKRRLDMRWILDRLAGKAPRVAGCLLTAAGVVALMGIITAETLYPGYSTADNMISDLGATEPPDSVILQPSSALFSGAMLATGLCVMAATYYVNLSFRDRALSAFLGLFGLGVAGVGVFNGSWGTIHALFAMTTFVSGALAATVSYRALPSPMRHLSALLGLVSLATLLQYFVLGDSSPLLEMGEGGVERWIAYPVLVWTIALGGFMMGMAVKD